MYRMIPLQEGGGEGAIPLQEGGGEGAIVRGVVVLREGSRAALVGIVETHRNGYVWGSEGCSLTTPLLTRTWFSGGDGSPAGGRRGWHDSPLPPEQLPPFHPGRVSVL